MLEINIYDKTYLLSNVNEYQVAKKQELKNKKTGEMYEAFIEVKHFSKMHHAINYLLEDKIRNSECQTLKEIKCLIEEFRSFVEREMTI